jgi:Bacterial SH3 domain
VALEATIRQCQVPFRVWRLLLGAAVTAAVTAGCNNSTHKSSSTTTRPAASTTAPSGAISSSQPQTSGPRTVLSPIGLNVRGAASKSAPVVGSAAQSVVLTVLGYTASAGGWFHVKGATVTGWITAQPTLSAPGEFRSYSSDQFAALYPATWTESALPVSTSVATTSAPSQRTPAGPAAGAPSSVVFRPASGAGDIVSTAAGSMAQLPDGRQGYGRTSVSQVVVCGITAGLVVFQQTGTSPATSSATSVPQSLTYLAQVRFPVDRQHALGFYADMPDLGTTFQIFKDFVASVTFSAPQCSG